MITHFRLVISWDSVVTLNHEHHTRRLLGQRHHSPTEPPGLKHIKPNLVRSVPWAESEFVNELEPRQEMPLINHMLPEAIEIHERLRLKN